MTYNSLLAMKSQTTVSSQLLLMIQLQLQIKALDAKGNQWLVDGDWNYFHPEFADPSILSE